VFDPRDLDHRLYGWKSPLENPERGGGRKTDPFELRAAKRLAARWLSWSAKAKIIEMLSPAYTGLGKD